MQSIDSIKTYTYGTSKDPICKKDKFNFVYIAKEDIKEHNPNQPKISDYPYRILIIGSSGSRKTNALINLINN